jgi:dolichyl-phosphate beta-glucosyltransferase
MTPYRIIFACLLNLSLGISPITSWAPRKIRFSPSIFEGFQSRNQSKPASLGSSLVAGWFSLVPKDTQKDITTAITPKLVIVIPAYNEEMRIESTLQAYRKFLLQSEYTSKILVVDDGSTDGTVQVVQSVCNCIDPQECPIQCLSLPKNQGKGAALAAGIQHIAKECGDDRNSTLILTQDADGSGDLAYLDCMMDRMKELLVGVSDEQAPATTQSKIDWSQRAIVTGNRNYNLWSPRGITRWGFQTAVKWIMNDLRVQDSQCGYKLMTLNAARDLYDKLEVNGWAHDVEVLYRAKLVDIPIQEISIDWDDKDGSKVVQSGVAKVSSEMLLDVIKLRWQYSNIRAWLSLGDF